jgi:hypothetical protein
MGMYICSDCIKKHDYLDMTNIWHSGDCEICGNKWNTCFTWDLDRFPEKGTTIEMQLDKLKINRINNYSACGKVD